MKHILTLIALLGAALPSVAAAGYSPMLEAGKTWKYKNTIGIISKSIHRAMMQPHININ